MGFFFQRFFPLNTIRFNPFYHNIHLHTRPRKGFCGKINPINKAQEDRGPRNKRLLLQPTLEDELMNNAQNVKWRSGWAMAVVAAAITWCGLGHTLTLSEYAVSSQYTGWEGSKVKDGLTGWGNCWSSGLHGGENYTEWVVVKVANTASGENHAVSSITLTPRPDGHCFPKDFRIDYTTDLGNTWYTIPSMQFTNYTTPTSDTPITFSFDTISAYFIRIYATKITTDGVGNWAFQLGEIAVNGQDKMWPFHTSLSDSPNSTYDYSHYMDADVNNMFSVYGIAYNETGSTFDAWTPNTCGVFYWGEAVASANHVLADKAAWLDHWWTSGIVQDHVRDMINFRDTDGYVWMSESQADYMGEGYHFDQNDKALMGVSALNCWDGNLTWLNTNIGTLRTIMNYQLNQLQGANGLLIINDPYRPSASEPDNNGRFFNPSNQILGGEASNYWDGWPFGYLSALDNVYFYASLLAMEKLELQLGNTANAAYYANLAATVKTNFNNTFWDTTKLRYIGCIDIDGVSHDYGFTFLNLEALYYGLGDQTKADYIFSWLDGSRTISGDTSTGSDIYTHVWAPRSNTKSAESVSLGGNYWWYSNDNAYNTCAGTNAPCTWGNYHENGGAIFYVSFYDIMSRIKYKGADNAYSRLRAITDQFHTDQLRRDPDNNVGLNWKYGISGEYPESGLVPCVYLYGFIGVSVDATQMTVKPALPTGYTYMMAQSIKYRGTVLEITSYSNQVRIRCTSNTVGRTFDFEGESVSGAFDKTKSLSGGDVNLIPTN